MPAFDTVYRDRDLLVVNKPAGVLSQASERGEEGLPEILARETGDAVYPVHRLDRETAGLLALARSDKAAASLSRAIREGAFRKEYLAVLTRSLPEKDGVLEDLLFFDRRQGRSFPVKRERAGVRKARLRYELIGEKEGLTLARVFPETGRTHQIRVQFAVRGCPLLGDGRYGGGSGPLHLFCRALSFPHPRTEKALFLSASPSGGQWSLFCGEIEALPGTAK